MAFQVGEISAPITADMTSFNRAIDTVKRTGRQLTSMITAPLVGAGTLALKTSADFETLRQSMDILNGSVEEGARNFQRLKEFSAGTPFQLQDLAKAQNTLQGFSLNADEAFNSIKMIGDIASVTGGDMQMISVAFGQAAAEGKLLTRDIRQLINQGVPAVQLLADSMGVATSEIFDLASQGEITFDKLVKAFDKATSEGGMFADGMQKQSQTLAGVFSTLKDNVSIALAEIGDALAETLDIKQLTKDLISNIRAGVEWFKQLPKEVRRMGFIIAGILGATGPVMIAIGALTTAIGAISAPVMAVVATVGVAGALLVKHWEEVEQYFTSGGGAQMWETLKDIVNKTVGFITDLWDMFGGFIMKTAKEAFTIATETIRTGLNAMSVILDVFTARFLTDWDGFLSDTNKSLEATFGTDGSARNILESFLSWLNSTWIGNVGGNIGTGIGNAVISALNSTGILSKDIPLIKDVDKTVADNIEFRRSKRAMERGMKAIAEEMKARPPEDVIIPASFDFDIGSQGNTRRMFETIGVGMQRVQNLSIATGQAIRGSLNPSIAGMRAKIDDTIEGLSLLEISMMGNMEQLNQWSQQIAEKFNLKGLTTDQINLMNVLTEVTNNFVTQFGQGMANLIVQGGKLLDILSNIGKLLASSAIQKGISILLSGGLAGGGFFGKGGGLLGNLFGSIFGGSNHSGGIIPGSGSRLIRARGGEGVFTPNQMRAMGNIGGSNISPKDMEMAFNNALGHHLKKLSPQDLYILTKKGRFGI